MPWEQTDAMNERIKMLADHLCGEDSIAELARRYGMSRRVVYKWIERYQLEGAAGLKERSRAPRHQPHAIAPEIVDRLLDYKKRWPRWGAPKLLARLQREIGAAHCPAESTVSEILKRHGLSFVRRRARRATPSSLPLQHAVAPNAVWCVDFKGWFCTGDGLKCTPLTLTDAYSRYLLRCQGLGGSTATELVQPIMISAFREYGLPRAMRSDNGTPFASSALGGLSKLSVWWLRLGIKLERIEPGKPQQNGRHERFHRTLEEHTARPAASSLGAQQRRFESFRHEYNHERPHEALDQSPPAEHYEPSPREYPGRLLPPRDYPDDWQKRRVRLGGQMKWGGRAVSITKALEGHFVGLEPIGEGRWAVWFENLELGIFEERLMRVMAHQTLRQHD
jgi:transposase InsO family protein